MPSPSDSGKHRKVEPPQHQQKKSVEHSGGFKPVQPSPNHQPRQGGSHRMGGGAHKSGCFPIVVGSLVPAVIYLIGRKSH